MHQKISVIILGHIASPWKRRGRLWPHRWQQRVATVTLQDGSIRLYSVKSGEKHLEVSVATTPSFVPHGGAKVVHVCAQPDTEAVCVLSLVILGQRPDHTCTHRRQRWPWQQGFEHVMRQATLLKRRHTLHMLLRVKKPLTGSSGGAIINPWGQGLHHVSLPAVKLHRRYETLAHASFHGPLHLSAVAPTAVHTKLPLRTWNNMDTCHRKSPTHKLSWRRGEKKQGPTDPLADKMDGCRDTTA